MLRPLGDRKHVLCAGECLYDGYVADGESLAIEILEVEKKGEPRLGERLYRHRFEGPVADWLGAHKASRGKDGLKFQFTIKDLTQPELIGAD